MKLQLSVFATLALTSLAQTDPYLTLDAYGTSINIPDNWVQYDQNQNHASGTNPTFSDDHTSITVEGNRWSAYAFETPQEIYEDSFLQFVYTKTAETAAGFQAICVDDDLELTGSNGQCFVLSTSQGWVNNMLNVAKLTNVGETSTHSIPIGRFFTGPIKYLAILQDSDGTDRTLGNMTISDLKLVQQEHIPLKIDINGSPKTIENHQLSYKYKGGNQDTSDWLMSISEDGSSIQVNGNQWKAMALPESYTITHTTVIEMDVVVTDPGDAHAICFDDNLDNANGENACVSFMTPVDNFNYVLTTELQAGVVTHLAIPYGQILGMLEGESKVVNYIAFVQDDDQADKRGSQSTYSNLKLYDEDRFPVSINVFGTDVSLPNIQDSFTATTRSTVQDLRDQVMSVSTDGKTVTAYGNSWKRFKLDTPFEVRPSSILKFTFSVPHEVEHHLICLLKDTNNAQDDRNDCYSTAGKDAKSDGTMSKIIRPKTPEGGTQEYEIWIGSYFTGMVHYIAFGQDNDKVYDDTRAAGEASWSNIVVYDLPSLNIGFNDYSLTLENAQSTISIENNQVSYESSSQDSTPVHSFLAEISEDGSSITVHGNMWRAIPIKPAKTPEELGDFIVSFDYVLNEPGDFHMVCFEDNLEFGDYDDPKDNAYDPKRCLLLNHYEDVNNEVYFPLYEPAVGEPHRYVANLSKMMDRFSNWNYFVIISDNDQGDKTGGEMVVSNIHVSTSLTSCLKDMAEFSFTIDDCTVDKFLDAVEAKMAIESSCINKDPLLEMFAFFDARTEMEVYKEIEHICNSGYEAYEYDFAKTISSQTQLVKEFIDGGTVLNYESDAEGSSLLRDGASIGQVDTKSSSHLFSWPKHHALDQCDIGAAMCCWVDSRGATDLVDNSDICYVNMKDSKRSAHVADGYSIYGDGLEGNVNCHGFAWGSDKSSNASALKGNALFKVGFMDSLYKNQLGKVEQVPGAAMCGCLDRMPVVTHADCTKASTSDSTTKITYLPTTGLYSAEFTLGTIEYTGCGSGADGEGLKSYYRELEGDGPNADYVDTRLAGEGGCPAAISSFLAGKGLQTALTQTA